MIGILLVTHGTFSEGIAKSIEVIMGKPEKVKTLTLELGEDIRELNEKVEKSVEALDDGDGVLIFVDLLGGSPYNVSVSNLKRDNVECITGLNLPMLAEAIDAREYTKLPELTEKCINVGSEGIVNARKRLDF